MKQIISLLLCIAMIASMLPINALAEEDATADLLSLVEEAVEKAEVSVETTEPEETENRAIEVPEETVELLVTEAPRETEEPAATETPAETDVPETTAAPEEATQPEETETHVEAEASVGNVLAEISSVTLSAESGDSTVFAAGDGTESNPYQVATAEQLDAIRHNLDAHYIQTADIDLTGIEWEPIGYRRLVIEGNSYYEDKAAFSGCYDGNGYVIKNMSISQRIDGNFHIGLFAINTGILKNITLNNARISIDISNPIYTPSGGTYATCIGSISGSSSGSLTNCSCTGNIIITGAEWTYIGGIVGMGTCNDCTNLADVTIYGVEHNNWSAASSYGGIIGYVTPTESSIENCVNYGNVTASADTFVNCGGITGRYGQITNCVNFGDISGTIIAYKGYSGFAANNNVGGIVGATDSGKNNNCVNFGNITATKNCEKGSCYAGGIAGWIGYYGYGSISNCYNLGSSIIAGTTAGRISGHVITTRTIDCYSVDSATVNGSIPSEIGTSTIHGGNMTNVEISSAIESILTSLDLPLNNEDTGDSGNENNGSGNTEILEIKQNSEIIGFYIYDVITKSPISGVEISVDEITATTDIDGTAWLDLELGTYTITLQNDEYTSQSLVKTVDVGNVYILSMAPTADTPTVFSAMIQKIGDAETDILRQKVFLEEGSSESYTLTAWAGYNGGIKEYRLIQEGKVLKTSEDGIFSISATDFSVESSIYILAVGEDGTYGELRKTNLIVQDNAVRDSKNEYSLKLGNKVSFTVDSTIPFLGGQELSIDLTDLPLYIEADGDRIKIGVNFYAIGFDDEDGATGGHALSDEVWDKIKESVKKNMDPDTALKNILTDTIGLGLSEGKIFSLGVSASTEFKIWGYMEGNANTGEVSGMIKVILDASISNEWQAAVGPVPVVITLEIKGSMEGSIQASAYITSWDDVNITGTLVPSISVAAGAGPGFANVASITINGSGTLEYTVTWGSDTGRSDILKFIAKLYIKLKLLFLEYTKDIAQQTWVLYESAAAPQALSAYSEADVLQAAMDVDNYTIAGRDYLSNTSPWMGEVSIWNVARSTTQSAKLLQSSIYEDTQLQIVQAGNTVMAFFLADDPVRADVDRTMLVYTIYDADTDTWSAPQAVEDDGTADFYPSVSVSDETIYVVWSDMKEAVGDVETLDAEALVSGIEITVARYDDENFTTETITDDEYMDATPAAYGDMDIWVKSKTNNMLGNDDDSVLCLYNGENVSEIRNSANVVELDIGSLGGKVCIALVTDGDGDYSTVDDRTMALLDTAGNTLQTVSVGTVAEVSFTEDGLCWYEGGYFRCLESTDGTSAAWKGFEGVVPGPWQIAVADGKTYLLFLGNVADEANSQTDVELFAYIYDGATWSNAVQLTELGLSIQNFDSYVMNGTVGALLTVSEMDTSSEETRETVNLCAVTVIEDTNYALVSFDCDDVTASNGSYTLGFTAMTANIGTGDGGDYSLELQYNGEAISSIGSYDGLSAGESAYIEGTFRLSSAPVQEGTYTILLSADDTDDSDNSAEVVLGLDDLAVEFIDYSISDDFYAMSLSVANNGLYDTDAVLNVCLGSKDGEVLLTESTSVPTGSSENFLVTINTKNIEFADDSLSIWFVVTSGHGDSFSADNEDFFIIYRPDEYASHTEHTTEVTDGVDPTCTENGFTEGSHCGICGEVIVTQEAIPATGHSYKSSITAPTCTEQGYTTHTCQWCDDSYVDSYVPASHAWDDGEITKEPTNAQDGEKVYTCTVCKETMTETLPRKIGDVNDDGSIDGKDLVCLMKYIVGVNVEVAEAECDTNFDDTIDILDVIRLMRYLAGA